MSTSAQPNVEPARRSKAHGFRPDIEGLRGVAVLIVVAFHCGIPGFQGGFVGVDVFFALSGYLITGMLVKEVETSSRIRLLHFYARRARRLLPAAALVLVFTLVTSAILLAPQELQFAGRAAQSTALYLSNVFFAVNASDYFSPAVETNPMLHTWSLAVEEQFYLFWPLLILLGMQRWRSRRALLALLGTLTLVSLATCMWMTRTGGTNAFYLLPARAWEFGVGGLAAMIPVASLRQLSSGWLGLGGLGIAAIVGSAIFISAADGFPGWIAMFPVCGTVAALIAGAALTHPERKAGTHGWLSGPFPILNSAPLQFLGRLSYSWYLWHWPFLVFALALIPNISIAGRCAVAVTSLGAAVVAYRFIENPIRFHPKLLARPILTLGLAATITIFSVSISIGSKWLARRLEGAKEMSEIAAAVDDIADMPRSKCVSLGISADAKSCDFADSSSATTIVLFGDSHAIQWFNPLLSIATSHGWKLRTLLKSGCPAADITPPAMSEAFDKSCGAWRANSIRTIEASHPALTIMASATTYLDHSRKNAGREVSLQEWQSGSHRSFEALSLAGVRVVVMRDSPRPSVDVPTCLGRSVTHFWYARSRCDLDRPVALRPAAFAAERAAANGLPHVAFVDMTDQLCDDASCWAVKNGMIVYRDDNHLTGRFASSMSPTLDARLMPLVSDTRR